MLSQEKLDAGDFLVQTLSHDFPNAITRIQYGEEQVGDGQAFRIRVTLYLSPEFHETKKMYEVGYQIVDFIYRQHGVLVHFMLRQEDLVDDEHNLSP